MLRDTPATPVLFMSDKHDAASRTNSSTAPVHSDAVLDFLLFQLRIFDFFMHLLFLQQWPDIGPRLGLRFLF